MNKIQNFSQFSNSYMINEKHHNESIGTDNRFTIVCVSANPEQMYEIQYLKNACTKYDVRFIYANLTKHDNFVKVVNGDCVLCIGERLYKLDKAKTLIMKRHAKMSNDNVHRSLMILANNDFLIVNSKESIALCADKAKSIEKFNSKNVSCPKSVVLDSNNIDDFDKVMSNIDFEYPVIAKTNRGSRGNGVFLFDTPQSLKGVAQYIISHDENLPCDSIVVQEKIDADYDLRIHVLRKESDPVFRDGDHYEVFAAMKREKLKHDYRSNVSLGSEYEEYEPTKDEIKLAINAAKAMKCVWCGVDIMRDKNTDKLYVLEVNCTPSLKGITDASKKDPASKFVKAMKEAFVINDSDHVNRDKMILGYKETFYINGLDEPLVGLLDSGNGSLTSLRADDIKVDKENDTVEWSLFGKKFKTKYDGDTSYFSSGGDVISQPTTRLDITHNGITYKNVRVKLSDVRKKRKGKHNRVLNVNRNLLMRMNAVVDTSKQHVNDK